VLATREVVVDQVARDADLIGDRLELDVREAVLGERPKRCADELLAADGRRCPGCALAADRRHDTSIAATVDLM
jgi:hypothetical protein